MSYLHDPRQLREYFAVSFRPKQIDWHENNTSQIKAIHDVYCDKEQSSESTTRSSTSMTSLGSYGDTNFIRKVESLENTISSLRHQLSETIKLSEIKQEKLRKVG